MSRNIVQVRYNLGSVKVQLSDEISTVDDLKRLLNDKHKIPLEDMCLTRDQRNADPISVSGAALLADVGIRPGVTVFLAGRYEKKVVEHAYVANGVVTPAGEQILKCPAESAEPLKPPISAAAVAPAETVAPTATATATAAHVPVIASKGSSLHEAPEERPLSPDFEIPAELMSPQVRMT